MSSFFQRVRQLAGAGAVPCRSRIRVPRSARFERASNSGIGHDRRSARRSAATTLTLTGARSERSRFTAINAAAFPNFTILHPQYHVFCFASSAAHRCEKQRTYSEITFSSASVHINVCSALRREKSSPISTRHA